MSYFPDCTPRKSTLGAVLDIVLQNGVEGEANRFKAAQDSYHIQKQKASIAIIFQSTLSNAVFLAGFAVMSAFAVWQITNEQGNVQRFIILFSFMTQLQGILNSLGALVQVFLDGFAETERMLRALKEESKIRKSTDTRKCIEAADIEFELVKFGPLKSLTFKCEEETITTILSLYNSERPTLGRLLIRIRIIELQNGIIRIGRVDIREYSICLLRYKIGFIPRKCKLLGEIIM